MIAKEKESKDFAKNVARRGILAHMEHHKIISEAFTKAIDTYMERHKSSEKTDRWLNDFPKNISKAAEKLHKIISESPQKVFDKYFGEEEEDSSRKVAEEKSEKEEGTGLA